MADSAIITGTLFLADLLIRIGISLRVIMRRLPVGVSLAWISIILIFPLAGGVIYLTLGEYRLGRTRKRRLTEASVQWRELLDSIIRPATGELSPEEADRERVSRLGEALFRVPPLPGNRIRLLPNADTVFPSLVEAIDQATASCDLEFYIWEPGGRVDDVAEALRRARQRGVRCRLLVDAVGGASFFKNGGADILRQEQIEVQAALPSSLLSMPFVRPDLRLHRKIVVIDHRIGFTGSLNMADPLTFKRDAGVGEWIDAMARIEGPAVKAMAASFQVAWSVETGQPSEFDVRSGLGSMPDSAGAASIQLLPSGPTASVDAIERMVLQAIYSARKSLVLTTPYFVPGESLLTALLSAAAGGVDVTLIVPAEVDSRMVHFASRAFQQDLVVAGVNVALYEGGLLHTKSITIDDDLSLFGSLNLDPRSMRLNFEVTLAIYDVGFTSELRTLQKSYLNHCRKLDLETCLARKPFVRLIENSARLLGPLL